MLATALEDIQLSLLYPETGLAPRGSVTRPFQTTQLPEGTEYVTQLALAADHVIACVVNDEGDEVLWVWQGREEKPSVEFAPPMGSSVRATVVAFGDAAIDQILQDARRHQLQIRPVDVRASDWDCSLEPLSAGQPAIRMGLRMIKGFREEDARRIEAARRENPQPAEEAAADAGVAGAAGAVAAAA